MTMMRSRNRANGAVGIVTLVVWFGLVLWVSVLRFWPFTVVDKLGREFFPKWFQQPSVRLAGATVIWFGFVFVMLLLPSQTFRPRWAAGIFHFRIQIGRN